MPCSFACILANQIYGLWLCVLFSCAAVAEDAATTTPGFAETNAVTNIHLAHEFVVARSRTPAFVLHRNERKMVCDPSLRPVTGVCFYVFKSTLLLTHTPKCERARASYAHTTHRHQCMKTLFVKRNSTRIKSHFIFVITMIFVSALLLHTELNGKTLNECARGIIESL